MLRSSALEMNKPNSQRLNELLQRFHHTNHGWVVTPSQGPGGRTLLHAAFWFNGSILTQSSNNHPNANAAKEEAAELALPMVRTFFGA